MGNSTRREHQQVVVLDVTIDMVCVGQRSGFSFAHETSKFNNHGCNLHIELMKERTTPGWRHDP